MFSDLSTKQRDKDVEHLRMLHLNMPPGVHPQWNAGTQRFDASPIPGMVEMQAGVPYAVHLNGNENHLLTVGCLQTRDSLSRYPERDKISGVLDQLEVIIWGRPPQGSDPGIPPLYTMEGLERNDRSAKLARPDKEGEGPNYTGSSNLAGTVEKGHGQGKVVPAVQVSYDVARRQISRCLALLSKLYRLVMPYCLSAMEMQLMDFHSIDNNIFTFGGLDPSGTGVQMNVSNSFNGGDLIAQIGSIQGSWHPDSSDDPTRPTMFVLFLRIPAGELKYVVASKYCQLTLRFRRRSGPVPFREARTVLSST